jgi:hypothetical protein
LSVIGEKKNKEKNIFLQVPPEAAADEDIVTEVNQVLAKLMASLRKGKIGGRGQLG